MSATGRPRSTTHWLQRGVVAIALLAGLKLGYDFGERIGGPWIGVLLAANAAVFGTLLAGALADGAGRWLARWRALR